MSSKKVLTRSEVPVHLTWDLTPLFATNADWDAALAKLQDYLPKIEAFKGRISKSATDLHAYMKLTEECEILAGKVYLYAAANSDVDKAVQLYGGMTDAIKAFFAKLQGAGSWFHGEFLTIDEATLQQFYKDVPELELYRHAFNDLRRRAPHVCSDEIEKMLAAFSEVSDSCKKIYTIFEATELKFPLVKTADGGTAQLTDGNFGSFLENPNAEVRLSAFEGMFGTFSAFRKTFAQTYIEHVKNTVIRARARKYSSVREMALFNINLPVGVYDTLISTVHKNLPRLNRYLRLRKKLLGLEQQHMYDLYVPTIPNVAKEYTYEEAQKIVLDSVRILGADYVKAVEWIFNSRCIDVCESEGKVSGAYHNSVFGSRPYMLLNWLNNLKNVFTLAHENGHAMHSYLSKGTQPYIYSGYTIFNAEFCSTTNEGLLTHHLLSNTTDPKMRAFLITRWLEAIRTTLVRQTLFAEFEHEVFKIAESNGTLTVDVLCSLYKGIVTKYYGAEVVIDPLIEIEWARIPHFYNPFYVYTYATGIASATAMCEQIISEGQPAIDRYLKFKKSGKSDYSLALQKAAGIDMSTPAPIEAVFDKFEKFVDELEALTSAQDDVTSTASPAAATAVAGSAPADKAAEPVATGANASGTADSGAKSADSTKVDEDKSPGK